MTRRNMTVSRTPGTVPDGRAIYGTRQDDILAGDKERTYCEMIEILRSHINNLLATNRQLRDALQMARNAPTDVPQNPKCSTSGRDETTQ